MGLPKLSICIPTYNRSDFLIKSLESIICSIHDFHESVEIIISDNASTDNTESVSRDFCKKYTFIEYKRNTSNLGAVENFRLLVSYARSEYIWLFSDDDLMEKQAIPSVLECIEKEDHLIILNYSDWSLNMSDRLCDRVIPILESKKFKNASELMHLVGFYISFISCNIIKKKAYEDYEKFNAYKDTGFPHVYFIYNYVLKNNCSISYLSVPLIRHRMGNESDFGDYSFLKYIVNGTSKIVKSLIECGYDKKSIACFRRQIFWGWVFAYFYNLKKNNKSKMIDMGMIYDSNNLSYFTIIIFILKYIPISFLKVLIRIRKIKIFKK